MLILICENGLTSRHSSRHPAADVRGSRDDMNRTVGETGRRSFGLRRVAPRAAILDPKPYVRTFLAEKFEELGFIPETWGEAHELFPSLNIIEPDIVVIVVSDDEAGAENVLKLLATALFHGRVMLMGSQARAAVARVQRLGEQLGLRMNPVLATPFRTAGLKERVADLLPRQSPPPLPVDFTEALGNGWLELWYQPKIASHALSPLV